MCLTVDEEKTKKMKKEKSGKITVWKVYQINGWWNEDGEPPYVYSPVYYGLPLNSGDIVSDRPTTEYPIKDLKKKPWVNDCKTLRRGKKIDIKINLGIHVFLTREGARKYKKDLKSSNLVYIGEREVGIFRCTADIIDLVAVGTTEYHAVHSGTAVFTKIHISPEDWSKALKGDFR